MRSYTSRVPSTPTPYPENVDLKIDETQDAYTTNQASPAKMTGAYGFKQERHWSTPSTFVPTARNLTNYSSPAGFILGILVVCTWICTASAVMVPFENCLDSKYIYTNQPAGQAQLQWVPLHVDAVFDTENPAHNLRVTVWGNVTGRAGNDPLPPWNSSDWNDPTLALNGKIQNEPDLNAPPAQRKVTTLHSKVDVLTYQPYVSNSNFCDNISNGSCPLGPVFEDIPWNSTDGLPSFNLTNDFSSTYSFTSFAPTFIIWYGDAQATSIGCVSTVLTPDLGGTAWSLKFAPLFVLILVGFATAFAGIFSPWGTSDVFHWTSNYGRDPDLLRLVTPGFGDCLQYIQFIALTGSLSLEYPGFYQPVTSQVSWSSLIFNQSFVSKAEPWQSLVDGIYITNGTYSTNGTYGLEITAQLDGISQVEDIWAGMMVWLLAIIGAVLLLIQIGFFVRWLLRYINRVPEEDLRAKNIPFSAGNIIRLVFSYFLLPIVALSTFQLVVSSRSAGYLVGLAVLTLVVIIGFAIWLMYLIATTKPRAHLFDDLPTVLLYGPLYNTYSDEAAAFALIPIILTIMRGITIGAVQPSGTAQIVILAVCEVIQILTLHAFRPFHSPTSMNAYHTGFSVVRFVSVILMIAFTPSLGVSEGQKGWIGYAILLIHGCVLVFGFFLNALQTIIEVIARLLGAGGDDIDGQTRGGLSKIFGARQLSRRVDRRGGPSRQSQLSSTAMLSSETATKRGYGRVRSESAGSMGILVGPNQRSSSALDARSIDAYSIPLGSGGAFTPTTATPGDASTFSFLPSPGQATRPQPAADPYYRPPRARRATIDEIGSSSPNRTRASLGSVDLSTHRLSQPERPTPDGDDTPGAAGKVNPAPAPVPYIPVFAPRADYSTREVDFYYGVRGPALNSEGPGRRLGTGPADPTSPVATATGWLKRLFGGKTKEKGKGFEVVRSARMPPAMRARGGEFIDEPPEGIPVAMGVLRNGPIESDDEDDTPRSKRSKRVGEDAAQGELLNEDGEPRSSDEMDLETTKVSKDPPLLPDLDAGESFKVPSRIASKASRHPSQRAAKAQKDGEDVPEVPEVPRKSSKRNSSVEPLGGRRLVDVGPSTAAPVSQTQSNDTRPPGTASTRLPFDRTNSQKRLSVSSTTGTEDSNLPSANGTEERPTSYGYVHQHNISRVDPDQPVDLLGSTAEVVGGGSRKPSTRSSISRRS
ncbi:integral membrane protein [Hypoxylon sp. FL0543]|nr:integral membrane protein [Hypoxylon sp. FL0543]